MPSDKNLVGCWWGTGDDILKARLLTQTVQNLRRVQTSRDSDNLIFLRMYGGKEAVSYYMGVAMGVGAYTNSASEPVHGPRLNIVQSCIDTVMSKLALSQIKSSIVTNGDYFRERKAKKLQTLTDGIFYQTKQKALSVHVAQDSLILGTGVQHIYSENGRICHEKVIPQEINVDEVEAVYGEPRNFYRTKMVGKEELADCYPDHADEIWNMKGNSFNNGAEASRINLLPVTASWHLSSLNDWELAAYGQYALAVGDLLLDSRPWTRPHPPFVFLRWAKRPMGFWGQGLAEQLLPLQVELNNVTRTVSDIIRIAAVPKMYVDAGSKVQVSQLDRTIGAVVYYQGNAPVFRTNPEVVGQELLNYVENIYQKAFAISGVSQLSAAARIPAGLANASGKALETFSDIETERFSVVSEAYQQFHIEVALQDIELARELYTNGEVVKASVPGSGFLKTITYEDCDLERDEYTLQPWPTNALADDPADRLKQLQDMAAAGIIDQDMLSDLMDFPDLKGGMNVRNSGIETIKYIVECILDDGEFIPPEPYFNLQLGVKIMQALYGMLTQQRAPQKQMGLVRQWIKQAQDMLMPPPPPGTPPPSLAGPPQALPMAPPTSPLLPQMPGS